MPNLYDLILQEQGRVPDLSPATLQENRYTPDFSSETCRSKIEGCLYMPQVLGNKSGRIIYLPQLCGSIIGYRNRLSQQGEVQSGARNSSRNNNNTLKPVKSENVNREASLVTRKKRITHNQ